MLVLVKVPTAVTKKTQTALTRQYKSLNPAQIRRDLLHLQDQLLKLVKGQAPADKTAGETTGRYAGKTR
ncbi:MAG: hypothetical protein H0V02_00880 [Nocardioidaceae bacterium]|nr:hypothetical protein [Nocardioidaceae bacterium]